MWVIFSYNKYSKSAKALANKLNIPLVTKTLPHYKVINWGSSEIIQPVTNILNKPNSVGSAVNKLKTFYNLKARNIPTVEFTRDIEQVKSWLDLKHIVYARTLLESSSGGGIKIVKDITEIPETCTLFTKGVLDPEEYRVHVVNNKIIDITLKRKPNGTNPNPLIRNHSSGWIFTRNDIQPPRSVEMFSKLAIRSLGLNFGAVDILYKHGTSKILEVNTAVGIEGTTLEQYAKAFGEIIKRG